MKIEINPIAQAIEDSFTTNDGNIADAIYHLATQVRFLREDLQDYNKALLNKLSGIEEAIWK